MTTGVINTPLVYKEWSGANANPKGNRKKPNAYTMNYARVSNTRGGNASSYVVKNVVAYPAMEKQERLARNQCILAVRDAFSQVDMIPFFAELGDTAQIMSKRLIQGLKILNSIKKRDWSAIRRMGKRAEMSDIPSAWLEWHFAIQPFLGEMNEFSEIMDNKFPSISFKEFSKYRDSVIYGNPANFASWTVTHNMQGSFYPINPNMHLINQMGISDLFGATWELTPWSWAVDYFTNVGAYIANLSPRYNSIVFKDFFETRTRRLTRSLATGYVSGKLVYTEAYGVYMKRDLLSSLPNVTLEIDCTLNLKRLSYLLSATALTLKGKAQTR